jgi:tRNA U34 5-carboxymethylaminomethyl modifying GTPase MnmE/TrmE
MPLNIIDTAGLRTSEDKVEQEGIKRAYSEIEQADVILLVFDAQDKIPDLSILPSGIEALVRNPAVSIIFNGMPLMCIVSFNTSRVVPAISVTIALGTCVNAFNKEDLPAFGLPAIATFLYVIGCGGS